MILQGILLVVGLYFGPLLAGWALQWAMVAFFGERTRPAGAVIVAGLSLYFLMQHHSVEPHLREDMFGMDAAFAFGVWLALAQSVLLLGVALYRSLRRRADAGNSNTGIVE